MMRVIDETSAHSELGGYELVRTYQQPTTSAVVRVRVRRDFYEHQSYAVAEVLTPGLTWTELATAYPQHWFDHTPSPRAKHQGFTPEKALGTVADGLAVRAERITTAATEGGTP